MILAACGGLPRTPENGVWYRLIPSTVPLNTALSSVQSKKTAGRFNPGPLLPAADQFFTLTFADDPLVAQFEVGAVLGNPTPGDHVPHPRISYISLNVQIVLSNVVDLTDVNNVQVPLAINPQELTGDWKSYQLRSPRTSVSLPIGLAPTQELGRTLFRAGVEAFRSMSAKLAYHRTLTVFPDNLGRGSSLTFTDSSSGAVLHKIP